MLREALAIAGGILTFLAVVPYLLDTIHDKTHPNIVTWFTWTLLAGIGTAAAWHEGATKTAILTGAAGLGTALVTIAGLRHGPHKYTRFDVACQVAALIGIILWRLTDKAVIALAIAVVIDFVGALPTIRHAWNLPHAETGSFFAVCSVGAFLTILSLRTYGFVSLVYPIYLACNNSLILYVILYRRRQVEQKSNTAAV